MKKTIYLLTIIVFCSIGAIGHIGNSYLQADGGHKILMNNLLLIGLISLITGIILSYYFPIIFPKGYAKQSKIGRVAIPVIFLCLSLALTIGLFHFVNSNIGHQTVIEFRGSIEKKWFEKGTKGNRLYYIGVSDFTSGKYYEFRVKRGVYSQIGDVGDTLSKKFSKGSLGVIYRSQY